MNNKKRIGSIFIRLWSHIYTLKLNQWLKLKRNKVYTQWISQFIGEVGCNMTIQRPLHLEGNGIDCIHIGSNTTIQANTVLGCRRSYGKDKGFEPEIRIGDNCSLGEYCHITAIRHISIGDGLLTGRFVFIGDNAHGGLSLEEAIIPPAKRHLKSKGDIVIGKNVWLGDKVTVLSGVTIGDNVIVAANAVVTHDLPSNCVAAGSPAKVVKEL